MQARSAFSIQRDVIFAIFLREMNARFKNYTFGNVWILLEPIVMIGVFMTLFGLRGAGAFGYSEPAVFILAGYLPFRMLWQSTMKRNMGALGGAMGILGFRQVRLFDVFLARSVVEGAVFLVSAVVLILGLMWLGFDAIPRDPLMVLFYATQLWLFATAFGILACVVADIAREVDTFINILTMPLLFLSAVIFPMSVIPYKLHGVFKFNPIVHANELIREAWLPIYTSPVADQRYLFAWILVTTALAVAAYRLRWQRMVAT